MLVEYLYNATGSLILALGGLAAAGWVMTQNHLSPLSVILPVVVGWVGGWYDRGPAGFVAPWVGMVIATWSFGGPLWGNSFLWPGAPITASMAAAGAIVVGRVIAELLYRLRRA